ncbi:DUF6758 family protein [Plantactinospora sp. WMMB334]|uniref:DUF6758 family protein n=1 Tax=Plantactinospora sp. WMMB334 TaxID=3404119 RepID=UPI003B9419A1
MGVAVSCPRCGGPVRAPDLMHTAWRCPDCGPVPPLHVAEHIGPEIVASVVDRINADRDPAAGPETGAPGARGGSMPLWCPWPFPQGWTMTGVGWAGDDRSGVRATAVACTGPDPLGGGPADLILVAEEPGVGLGTRLAGAVGIDPGPQLAEALTDPGPGSAERIAHAKVRADGHPTPLWAVKSPTDRSAYAGEARGIWLYAIAWPASAGYLLAEDVELHDLTEWTPPELVYGAPSPYLHGRV